MRATLSPAAIGFRNRFGRAARRFFLVSLLLGVVPAGAAQKSGGESSLVSFAPVRALLERSGGSLTPDLRAAYVDWAEMSVLQALSDAHQEVPADCMAEVQGDATLRDALFAAIDPPDPSILQNYSALRVALGPAFVAKYRALIVADAVARRVKGIRTAPTPTPAPAVEAATPGPPDPLVDGIAAYIKQSGATTLQLFEDQQAQQKLAAFLQGRNIDPVLIGGIGRTEKFHNVLKRVLVALGERPARRDPFPDSAAWLRYLVSIYESVPADKSGKPPPWPRFPMARAPWPLLMPLSRTYPLREAGYIWEEYEGLHGPDRMHTYGPFEYPPTEWPRELRPSAWYWSAFPDVIVHGGECTTMAPMSVEAHVALDVPAVMAGQPGHCNLMSFENKGNYWVTDIEQAFAGGPDVTMGAWLFKEIGTTPGLGEQNGGPWAVSEYHIGLAQAMNIGLRQYIDTRIAVNLYHHLSPGELATTGSCLLMQAIRTNPFNPAPWYLLGRQTHSADEGIALIKRAMQDADMARRMVIAANGNASLPKVVGNSERDYWQVVEETLAKKTILNRPSPRDPAEAERIYAFLKTVPELSAAREAPYIVTVDGTETEVARLEGMVQEHLAGSKKGNSKSAKKDFAAELNAYSAIAGDEEGKALLEQLKAIFTPGQADDPYLLIVEAAEKKLNRRKS